MHSILDLKDLSTIPGGVRDNAAQRLRQAYWRTDDPEIVRQILFQPGIHAEREIRYLGGPVPTDYRLAWDVSK
ncbi:MAG: hypothetical protein P8163_02795 [Candidatus Thiodiazotropha sp.]